MLTGASKQERCRDFPPEILAEIFKHIHGSTDIASLSRVNRNWNSSSYDRIWEIIEIHSLKALQSFSSKFIHKKMLFRRVFKHEPEENASKIRILDLSRYKSNPGITPLFKDPSRLIGFLLPEFKNLESLILPAVKLLRPNQIFCQSLSLQSIDLSFCLGNSHGCFDELYQSIAKSCPNLSRIVLAPAACLDPTLSRSETFELLGSSCPLKSISIPGNKAQSHTHSSHINSLFRSCHFLERVDIEKLCCPEYRTVFRSIIIHSHHHLRILNVFLIESVSSYSDLILLGLSAYARNLEEFRFGPSPSFSDDAVIVLFEECKKLKVFRVPGSQQTTNESLFWIGKLGHELREISVSFWPKITKEGLTYLSDCKKLLRIECLGI